MEETKSNNPKTDGQRNKSKEPNMNIYLVSSADSAEFTRLKSSLTRSTVIALDAEWKPKPKGSESASFQRVSVLQVACRLQDDDDVSSDVFLIDLLSIPLPSVWEPLNEMFVSPDVLKLGFKFKNDLVNLSTTFTNHGCPNGFLEVKQYVDISRLYHYLQFLRFGKPSPKNIKGLAAIFEDMLGIPLSKAQQCSDWEDRPLTEEQQLYSARDALCLLQIFDEFQNCVEKLTYPLPIDTHCKVVTIKLCKAKESENGVNVADGGVVSRKTMILYANLLRFFKKYGANIQLKASDLVPKSSKKYTSNGASTSATNTKKQSVCYVDSQGPPSWDLFSGSDGCPKPKSPRNKSKQSVCSVDSQGPRSLSSSSGGGRPKSKSTRNTNKPLIPSGDWQGPLPWDSSLGGDGRPKFLLDSMLLGLAKDLRRMGIDAAVLHSTEPDSHSTKPDSMELLDQASKEKRVLLTREAKLLKQYDLAKHHIYQVKNHKKKDQLSEVIQTFQLKISENQLMSRCLKCNGEFELKPLDDQAIKEAASLQTIPEYVYDEDVETWQCNGCHQLYWGGNRHRNAIEKLKKSMQIEKLKEE